jgi:hypothetical protein
MKKTKKIMALGLAAIMTVGARGFTANAMPPKETGQPGKNKPNHMPSAAHRHPLQTNGGLWQAGEAVEQLFNKAPYVMAAFTDTEIAQKAAELSGLKKALECALFEENYSVPADEAGHCWDVRNCAPGYRLVLELLVPVVLLGYPIPPATDSGELLVLIADQIKDLHSAYSPLLQELATRYGIHIDATQLYTDIIQLLMYQGFQKKAK